MRTFLEFFIPLFVAIDPLGMLPVFLALTDGMTPARRRRVTFEAVAFAFAICIGFMFLGAGLFRFLGITSADFKIAGGVLLLVLAVVDLVKPGKPSVDEQASTGLFPLAMPLIAGPAALTTTLVLGGRSYTGTALSLSANFAALLIVLLCSGFFVRWIGRGALRACSKLVMVLLAAIAVNLIRTGVMEAWKG